MANTLSQIGGVIQGNWLDEEVVAGVADGVALAGNLVGFTGASGAVGDIHRTFKTGNFDEFIGILLPHHKYDMDTLIGDGEICNIVVPQSGHLYGVFSDNLGGALVGEPLCIGLTDGALDTTDDIEEEHVARLFSGTTGDTFYVVAWGV